MNEDGTEPAGSRELGSWVWPIRLCRRRSSAIWSCDGDCSGAFMLAAIGCIGDGSPSPGGVRGGAPSLSGPGDEVFQILGPRAGRGV